MRSMMLFFFIAMATILAAAEEGWQITEEVVVNGSTVVKRSYLTEQVIKVVNEAPTGSTETIVDLANDTVTIVNHFQKTYQVSKLSDYLKFAEGIANGLKNSGYADPEKLDPKIVFVKKGSEKIGSWDTIRYLVTVDGKEYQEIWVAPALKTSPIIELRKKYAAYLPETLVKYRVLEEKIRDKAEAEGLVIKSTKIPLNKKLPRVEQTLKEISPLVPAPALFTIPKGYTDKTVSAAPANK